MAHTPPITYSMLAADATLLDPRLFLDDHRDELLWESEEEECVIQFAQSMLNKQSAIVIAAVDHDPQTFCLVSVDWHPWAITLYDRPALLPYLLPRATTTLLPR